MSVRLGALAARQRRVALFIRGIVLAGIAGHDPSNELASPIVQRVSPADAFAMAFN